MLHISIITASPDYADHPVEMTAYWNLVPGKGKKKNASHSTETLPSQQEAGLSAHLITWGTVAYPLWTKPKCFHVI